MARPTDYRPEYIEQAKKLCRLGATDKEIADFFGCSVSTLGAWRAANPELDETMRTGKLLPDLQVADRLFQRTQGYSYEETKVSQDAKGNVTKSETVTKHLAPDVTAMIFWLKNRRPDLWRQAIEVTGKDGAPLEGGEQSQIERARRLVYLLKKAREEGDGEEVEH
jgi:hypothetical protein